ncbi:MAG: hypothetical protein JW727_03135 [Candidatus Aenigmarchaeota archaeon]|nr:hypothetical protein [Candidatus Aenigmarchaeota archaeon]
MADQIAYGNESSSILKNTYSNAGKGFSGAAAYASRLGTKKKIALGIGAAGAGLVLAYAIHNLTGWDPTGAIEGLPGGETVAEGMRTVHDKMDQAYLGIKSAIPGGPEEAAAQSVSGVADAPLSPEEHERVLRALSVSSGNVPGAGKLDTGLYQGLSGSEKVLDGMSDEMLTAHIQDTYVGGHSITGLGNYMVLHPERADLIMDSMFPEDREGLMKAYELSLAKAGAESAL